ncbi:Hypothetical predicted protein [Octopus vulgaris]|uniref:Uncharacterized protein n=1 Tax=Octopus vulgaris TaxID=6645 RepID=A0AA36FHE1_OCTVU|nr:Hypothetical predicted protein [Octopus vulgaris]
MMAGGSISDGSGVGGGGAAAACDGGVEFSKYNSPLDPENHMLVFVLMQVSYHLNKALIHLTKICNTLRVVRAISRCYSVKTQQQH